MTMIRLYDDRGRPNERMMDKEIKVANMTIRTLMDDLHLAGYHPRDVQLLMYTEVDVYTMAKVLTIPH